MKRTNKDVKDFLESRLNSKSTKTQIRRALTLLEEGGIHVEDVSDEYGYLNFHIPTVDGMIRIYRHQRNGICVQAWTPARVSYSGIPVFFGGSLIGSKER